MNLSSTACTSKSLADFRPLKAWRYDPSQIDLKVALAPPYDIISPSKQQRLYDLSPYNCVRLILNQETPSDHEGSNRYTRARELFNAWRNNGPLIQDPEPCFYLYHQAFKDPMTQKKLARSALLGIIKLEPFDKGIVIPHEKTLKKPREDRRKLLETTQTNFSPVFGLYEDPQKYFQKIFQKVTMVPPVFEVPDEDEVWHRLWVISDPKISIALHEGLREKKIYIADGHHRYQTALEYGKEKRRATPAADEGEIPSDFALMALVEFYDPGLVLMPTHRMITTLDFAEGITGDRTNPEVLIKALEDFFDVKSLSSEQLRERLAQAAGAKIIFGLVFRDKQYLLTLKDWKKAKARMVAGKPDVWYQLDVTVLSHLVLASLWGIPETKWESVIAYTHDNDEAVKAVQSGTSKVTFLLQAPRVEILREMGNVGELLPQKSTYFYPKLASGTVFYRHE